MTNTNDIVTEAVRVAMALAQEDQNDLSGVLGVTQGAVSQRLRGRIRWSLADLDKLAGHYGVTVADLVTPMTMPLIASQRAVTLRYPALRSLQLVA